MNKITLLLALLPLSSHAEVFKCSSASGKIEYQSKPCPSADQQQAVTIKNTDSAVIKKAQDDLNHKLAAQAEKEAAAKREQMQNAMLQNRMRPKANGQRPQSGMGNRQPKRKNR